MKEEIKNLKAELEKARSQLYVFYELTKAMRRTLRIDEITYIILTGLTAHEGLRFNRAAIFFTDQETRKINGFMGIGPIDNQEATRIWHSIEKEKKNLYDLIDNYHHIKEDKVKPPFMKLIQSLSFPLDKKGGLLFNALYKKDVIHIRGGENKFKNDPLIKSLNLEEFLIVPLWIKGKPNGVMVVDNYITKNPISDDEIKIFTMFMEQAQGALENSQSFESTLTQAHTDPLTSLWNYGYFQYRLDEEIAKTNSSLLPLSVMMVDIDNFKKFNDSYGHIQGDEALRRISQIFKENCRKIDILCRYGGEEFSLILPANNKKEAALLAERIRKSVEGKTILNNNFTISIGIASYPKDSTNKITLIQKADQALYAAKRAGKNRVVLA
ncbi:MAG: sensor domain-containing diguanylate cyclase [Candidatus Omnitrophota bacterium]